MLQLKPMINVEVSKNGNESNVNVIRRFTKRVQSSGVLPKVRSLRYSTRKQSEYVKKKHTLKVLVKKDKIQELIRLGKIKDLSRNKK